MSDAGKSPWSSVDTRIARLNEELTGTAKSAGSLGKINHWISQSLLIIAVLASLIAGIGGVGEWISVKVAGVIALIPAGIAMLAAHLKFHEKANWHYLRMYRSNALRSRLSLQLPLEPSADDVAAIAKERDAMEDRMEMEWQSRFSPDFAGLNKGNDDKPRT